MKLTYSIVKQLELDAAKKLFCVFILATAGLMHSCANLKMQTRPDIEMVQDSLGPIIHSFYLIGDAGNSDLGSPTEAIQDFGKELSLASKNSTAIFLGDNIYPSGLSQKPKKNELAKHRLMTQINAAKKFKGRPIFIPGNHDWYSGLDALKAQEKLVEKHLGKNSFLPENGCPIETIDISEQIILIIVDSEWYITKWDHHPKINDDCEIKSRSRFLEEIEGEIKKARGKTTVIATHHPMLTNGPHGGYYSFKSHMLPIPGLGSLKNIVRTTSGISPADINNKRYRELRKFLMTLSQENDKTVFVSGHEHSLQLIKSSNVTQIVSGSGSKESATKNTKGGVFSYGAQGFARLDVFKNGSSRVKFYAAKDKKWVYEAEIFKADENEQVSYQDDFPDRVKASVYEESETRRSNFYKRLWGERYRKYFGTEVDLPTVNLDTLYGGLKPVRKGGGNQSKSLRLVDAKGREYVMRALRKNAVQYLQSVLFTDQYVSPDLKGTETETLVLDAFTGSHPYAPFTIAEMSKAVDVYYAEPRLFYVPKQKAIGRFNEEFGDEIYMIEPRADDNHGDKAGFGYSNKLISTFDMLEELREDESHKVDESAYIRARLFDMVIGDWDRHQDQWRWAVFEEGNQKLFKPVPRDRDQAFSVMDDGFLLKTATFLTPPIRLIRSFSKTLKDPKWFNLEAYPLDVSLITQSEKSDWDREVQFIMQNLTDEVIDRALMNFPIEVRDSTMVDIRNKLIARRNNLQKTADAYYKIVNKHTIVRGTDKDDWFQVERLKDGNTLVKAYRIIDGKKEKLFHERIYKPHENKEIWLYALDDDDYLEVFGSGPSKIKLRLVGGQNKDTYNIERGGRVHLYDYQSKPNEFITDKGHRHVKDNYYTNTYNLNKVRYNSKVILPIMGYNPDDGIKLGVSGLFTRNGFDNEEFSSKHMANAYYFFATEGFDFQYSGEYTEFLDNLSLGLNARFTSPNFAINFFGFGNSTPNLNVDNSNGETVGLDYNRVKQSIYQVGGSLIKKGEYGSQFSLGVNFQSIGIANTPNRFINEFLGNNNDLERDEFINAEVKYTFINVDEIAFPTLAFHFETTVGYTNNLNNSNAFSYLKPKLGIAHKLDNYGNIVLATKIGGHFNFSNDFEFYQAASIGANNGLRGYRNERFSGRGSFYQSSDLRFNLKRTKTSVLPLSYGIYTGFDYGRVWINDEFVTDPNFNDDALKTSYGGGVYMNLVDMLSAQIGLFNSDDNLRFSFSFGFQF